MCTNYIPSARHEIAALQPGLMALPPADWAPEVFPGGEAPVLLRGEADAMICRLARFGLVPRWCRDETHAREISRGTYNARSETAAQKPSFRSAWHARQWALAPMQSFFEPCWEDAEAHQGRSVRWQMSMADGSTFAVAGLWESWTDRVSGEITCSFTLLTVNADGHPVMGRMHRPGDEKRMPVIVPAPDYAAWLHATPANAAAFMQRFPAEQMHAVPAPRAARMAATGTAKVKPPKPPEPRNLSLF